MVARKSKRLRMVLALAVLLVLAMAVPALADGQAGTTLSAYVTDTTPSWTITYK